MNFLSSKNVSLGCAAINGCFAVAALTQTQWLWFFVSAALAGFCFNNYLKAQ